MSGYYRDTLICRLPIIFDTYEEFIRHLEIEFIYLLPLFGPYTHFYRRKALT